MAPLPRTKAGKKDSTNGDHVQPELTKETNPLSRTQPNNKKNLLQGVLDPYDGGLAVIFEIKIGGGLLCYAHCPRLWLPCAFRDLRIYHGAIIIYAAPCLWPWEPWAYENQRARGAGIAGIYKRLLKEVAL